MSNIIHGIFESHWDGDSSVIATTCSVNLDTKEVFNIERVDNNTVEQLDYEDVVFNEETHRVVPQSEYENEPQVFYYKD